MEARDLYHTFYRPTRVALDLWYNRKVEGLENIPDEPAIYVANHSRVTDSFLMAASFTEHTGKAMRLGAKKEYFTGEGVDNKGKLGRTSRWFVERTGQIPVVRKNGTRDDFNDFHDAVRETLSRGDSVGLHAEGTRTDGDKLYKFKVGAAQIAVKESVLLVPVGITFSEEIPLMRDATVTFGEPIDTTSVPTRVRMMGNRAKVEYVNNLAEERVAEITGLGRAHVFAEIYDKGKSSS
ncbi:1-acyl-sn-glycerol-3-phosphate acyltransferase [Candidatus Saccharibacteria bacterium]|nr:1-acyl-sn-glycerol-3-phosphate acyltransferase [Candidatus Saccharibacteria bacterium]